MPLLAGYGRVLLGAGCLLAGLYLAWEAVQLCLLPRELVSASSADLLKYELIILSGALLLCGLFFLLRKSKS